MTQPPPSYDQVIQEKTQEEHIVKPTAAPRRPTCTTTCATQTDPVRDNTDQSGSKSDVKQHNQEDPTHTCTRSVTVYWDIPVNPVSAPAEATPSSSNSEPSQRPVPLPRTKSRKQATPEKVNDKSLVELSENCDSVHSDAEEASSNKYLKELLEVFSAENQCEENGDIVNQSDEASQGEDAVGEMNNNNSQRNIRARIQAFESQAGTEEGSVAESAKPEPRPRKAAIKPPVAAKPSVSLKPQFDHSADDYYQNVSSINVTQNHTPAPRPQPPKKMAALSIKEELETLHSKAAIPNRSRPSVLTRANSIYEEEPSPLPPVPPVKPFKEPLKPNLNINNHNSASIISENECVNSLSGKSVSLCSDHIPVKPQRNVDSNGGSFSRQSAARRPTTIRVPSKSGSRESRVFPDWARAIATTSVSEWGDKPHKFKMLVYFVKMLLYLNLMMLSHFRRHSTTKILPPRPPPAKTGPGRPPPPSLKATGRSVSAPWDTSPRPQAQKPHRKGPVLPPRPNPGHRLYNKYTLELPHGIAAFDYNGSNTGELSFQKNEVLLLLEEIDRDTFECQVGDTRGRVHKSRMKVITPLASDMYPPQVTPSFMNGYGKKVQVIHDFIPEGPGELGLRAGDVVTMVEQVDNEWYRGTCRGSTGFFPMNYVQFLHYKIFAQAFTNPGPRCVARFDFEGEHSDELSFCEGDVIQLKEYIGQEWARGQNGVSTGIFPLNFVEVIEDLPPPPSQQQTQTQPSRIALPGTVSSLVLFTLQASQSKVDWAVALYDYAGKSEDDLSFQQGDCILITRHINAEWSCGRLNGKEGMFPRAFIESNTGMKISQFYFVSIMKLPS
uniref:SH3 domain containing 19 n=1 Tax=Seriola dumerili TaxID=41447 RepID=A0A3B4V9W0_SERDU